MENILKIAITQGDGNGVGLELALKTFAQEEMFEFCIPILYANEKLLLFHRKTLGLGNVPYTLVSTPDEAEAGRLNLIAIDVEGVDVSVTFGKPDLASGRLALVAMEMAVKDAAEGKVDAIVACPIHLPAMPRELFPYKGIDDFLAAQLGGEALTLFCNPYMRVALATNHIPLSEVPSTLNAEMLEARVRHALETVKRDFLCSAPRVAVLALNPHAGAAGILGADDEECVMPVVRKFEEEGKAGVFGPYAADAFFGAAMYKHFDCVLALYHDQGVTPFKTLSMTEVVQLISGLKVACAAPSHGPAFDKAGKGEVDEASFRHAIYTVIDVTRHRLAYDAARANPLPPYTPQHERMGGERRRFPAEAQ